MRQSATSTKVAQKVKKMRAGRIFIAEETYVSAIGQTYLPVCNVH